MYLNIIEALHNKPTPAIILKGKKMKTFPLGTETRQGYPLLILLFNMFIMEVLNESIRKKRKSMEFETI
jgi:hypothetical protein